MQHCVKCNGPSSLITPWPNIHYWSCRDCRGLWFPAGMLARELTGTIDYHDGEGQSRQTAFRCPTCNDQTLVERPFGGDAALLIDSCAICSGIFLDANELAQAKAIAHRKRAQTAASAQLVDSAKSRAAFELVFAPGSEFVVKQRKEWFEIITNIETRNKYDLFSATGERLGHIAEVGTGAIAVLYRLFLKTRRPLVAYVWNVSGRPLVRLRRPFYWFFSDIFVDTADGDALGSVHRRFSWFSSRYQLRTRTQNFASIARPWWRIWRFPLLNATGETVGEITKRWGGFWKERLTSADAFSIRFGSTAWTPEERAIILATSVTIDLDHFETQSKSGSSISDGIDIFFNLK